MYLLLTTHNNGIQAVFGDFKFTCYSVPESSPQAMSPLGLYIYICHYTTIVSVTTQKLHFSSSACRSQVKLQKVNCACNTTAKYI